MSQKRRSVTPTRWLQMVNLATLFTCLLFLFDGYAPGWSFFTCVSLLMFCATGIAWTVGSWRWLTQSDRPRCSILALLRMTATPLLAVSCAIMVMTSLPTRIGLWASHDQLQALLIAAPVIKNGQPLNQRIGVYDVQRFAADGSGGVYFVTDNYRDALSKQGVSLGFAFHPSRIGTPFGRANYQLSHVCGEWYTFAASDTGE